MRTILAAILLVGTAATARAQNGQLAAVQANGDSVFVSRAPQSSRLWIALSRGGTIYSRAEFEANCATGQIRVLQAWRIDDDGAEHIYDPPSPEPMADAAPGTEGMAAYRWVCP